jgi:uracil-DNA glycosylase
VALGGTAARALFGAQVRPTIDRGKRLAPRLGPMDAIGLVTFHPSAALRARDDAGGDAIRHALTEDLRLALRFVDASRRDAHASVLVDNLQGGE